MKVHATLTINVVYDDAESCDEVREQLDHAAKFLVNRGMLSGDGPMTVNKWEHTIETTKRKS